MARKIRGGGPGDKVKLIMENWRKFLQEEKGVDLSKLTPDEKELLNQILAVAEKEQAGSLTEEVPPGLDPNRSMSYSAIKARKSAARDKRRKKDKKERSDKIKAEIKKIELEYWKSYVNDFLCGQYREEVAGQRHMFKKAYEKSGCQSQEQCALLRVPVDGAEGLKNVLPGGWLVIDRYYKDWFEQNKSNWEGGIDKTRIKRATVGAQTKDVSDLPGLAALKNNPLYKSLSKKLCPDSLSGGISLTCLAKFGFQVADFFPGE